MKNLTKIFLAVVALAAFSCTTDATEDLGVGLGGEQTTISLSLESTRTQLGEKADGLYPLYWSEGDKISVNGIESNAAAISADDAAKATFTVNGVVDAPYCIAYPAAPAGQVLFAAEQSHTSNTTFGQGVSTMYAYSESGLNAQLQHLTGVLKVGVVGSAKLVLAQISTIDRAPIAGAFGLDFTSGELTATDAAKATIEYSFGEGVQLSSEPTYIHVAVPAGIYEELYVTLYDEAGGVMYATVKAPDTKPLTVGKVREFTTPIPYAATDKVFVIKDVATLKAFAEAAPTLEMDALFVNDIDMSAEEWTPIEGYTKTLRGNGYAIKGLKAPLFGTTNASIKGLHLRDVALVSADALTMGAFANTLTAAEGVSPVISNCSAEGTFTINNSSLAITASTTLRYGGFVGALVGAEISNSVNKVALNISTPAASCTDGANLTINAGGFAGRVEAFGTTGHSTINNCSNDAAIQQTDAAFPIYELDMAGITGCSLDSNEGFAICNSTNNAEVSFKATTAYANVAGILGYIYMDSTATEAFMNNTNNGSVILRAGTTISSYTFIGGVVARGRGLHITNAVNNGAVTLEAGATLPQMYVAGIIADAREGEVNGLLTNITNNAPITIASSSVEGTGNGNTFIGGVTGWCQAVIEGAENTKKGTVTFSGNLNTDGKRAATTTTGNKHRQGTYSIAGVCAYKTVGAMNDCTNHADIIFSGTQKELNEDVISQVKLAGIVAYTSRDDGPFTMDGTIKASGTFDSELHVAGMIAYPYGTVTNKESDAKIILDGTFNGGLVVGGVVAWTHTKQTGHVFNGSIEVTENAVINNTEKIAYIGGIFGRLIGYASGAQVCDDCTNNGNITFKGKGNNNPINICGIVGDNVAASSGYSAYKLSNLTNLGTLSCSSELTGAVNIFGITSTNQGSLTNCTNGSATDTTKGSLTMTGTISTGSSTNAYQYICGICDTSVGSLVNCNNYGAITMAGNLGHTFYGGGIARQTCSGSDAICDSCNNYGNITVSGTIGEPGKLNGADIFYGGLFDLANTNTSFINCHNYGDFVITESAQITNAARIGGLVARFETSSKTVTLDNCSNNGDVIFAGKSSVGSAGLMTIGGCIGCVTVTTPCIKGSLTNNGDVILSGENAKSHDTRLGGVFADIRTVATLAEGETAAKLINNGKVTFSGSVVSYIWAGGVAGYLSATPATNVTMVNTGDITASGTFDSSNEKTTVIGGIAGESTVSFDGATSFCNISAPGFKIGMIMGSPRANGEVVATNAKLGGKISVYDEEDDSIKFMDIPSDSFYDYIYGSGVSTDWTGTDNYDGATHLSVKPVIE